jgi:hypothetical protein
VRRSRHEQEFAAESLHDCGALELGGNIAADFVHRGRELANQAIRVGQSADDCVRLSRDYNDDLRVRVIREVSFAIVWGKSEKKRQGRA